MVAGDGQRGLVGVGRLAADPMQQQGSTRGRLRVPVRDGQPGEQTPPVVDQRHDPGQDLTALVILRREPRPAPLVLQLVEYVLRLGPIPVQLRHTQYVLFQRRDQHRILI